MTPKAQPVVAGLWRTAVEHGGHVVAGDLAALVADLDRSRAGLVGQHAGPDDRVLEAAGLQRGVGLSLGAEVDGEGVVTLVVRVGAHRADDHVARDPVGLGGLDQLDRAAVVHRLLALGPAARARAGGEDHRIHSADRLRDLLPAGRLEVADDRLATRLSHVVGVIGVADQRDDLVAVLAQQPRQVQRDLPVASGDGDSHPLHATGASPRGRAVVLSRARVWARRRA